MGWHCWATWVIFLPSTFNQRAAKENFLASTVSILAPSIRADLKRPFKYVRFGRQCRSHWCVTTKSSTASVPGMTRQWATAATFLLFTSLISMAAVLPRSSSQSLAIANNLRIAALSIAVYEWVVSVSKLCVFQVWGWIATYAPFQRNGGFSKGTYAHFDPGDHGKKDKESR